MQVCTEHLGTSPVQYQLYNWIPLLVYHLNMDVPCALWDVLVTVSTYHRYVRALEFYFNMLL